MEMRHYQRKAAETAIYPDAGTGSAVALAYVGLGLAGEAGEIANKIKKVLRDDGGEITPEKAAELRKEVGDVLWYVARMATELQESLNAVAQHNLDKLASRRERGVVGGSGDNR